MAATMLALAALAVVAAAPAVSRAQGAGVDPEAVKMLRRMTDYLGSLKQFSVRTQNTIEDVLDSGHKVYYDVSSSVIVSRPNKIHAERKGELLDQVFYYDGKTLTLYNPSDKVYATVPAPGTFEEMFKFMYESLGFLVPVSDLVYRDAFPLLMQDVTFAVVLGKTFIGGVKCDHLLFSRPGVDFQVWVAEGGRPLPRKYVVTDTTTPALLSVSALMGDWNVAPAVADARFTFVPPQGVKRITFMPLGTSSGSNR
jgi:hypothetical protein